MAYSVEEINKILGGSDREKHRLVIDQIKAEASLGDARSNYMLAKWYSEGLFGFKRSKSKFNKHMKIAMRCLLPDAIYDYGVVLDSAEGKPERAFGYYVLAAILGDLDAIDAVMRYFIYGLVVERDDFIASSLQIRKDYLARSME
jgi:TPR repeat protein